MAGFKLPTVDHPARALMGDLHSVVETLHPDNVGKLMSTMQASRAARAMFATDKTGAMRRVCYIILRADTDERWLVSFGPRGGWRKEWNFGNRKD